MRPLAAITALLLISSPGLAAAAPAKLVINEVGTLGNGCDLVELRVIDCGSMQDISLWSRLDMAILFPPFTVSRGDFVIVHIQFTGADCIDGACADETAGPAASPRSGCPSNFDTGFDWHTSALMPGLPGNFTTLYLLGPTGTVMDAALFSSNTILPPPNSPTEQAAAMVAGVGEWQRPEGGVPPGGFTGPNFTAYAVKSLINRAPDASLQRIDDSDDNHMGDWTTTNTTPTIAQRNVGQNPTGNCVTAVEDPLLPTRLRLEARPSVARGPVEFHLATPLAIGAKLEIFDAQGRSTRVLWWWAGSTSVTWDGRDGWGREVAPGPYFARVTTKSGPAVARVTRTR